MDVLVGRCDRKVVGGKLFRIKVVLERDGQARIMRELSILGDFFIHPEDSIEGLEEAVRVAYDNGQDLNVAISRYIAANEVTLFGGSSMDLSIAVMDAVDDALSPTKGGSP